MARPHKFRKISNIAPKFTDYHPKGADEQDIDQMFLSMEEFEALRLRHYENLKQTEAAEKMQISQTTFSRILAKAYKKITKALVEGYGLAIQKNIYPQSPPYGRGRGRGQGRGYGHGPRQGWGRGRGKFGFQEGPTRNSMLIHPQMQEDANPTQLNASAPDSPDFESSVKPPQWMIPPIQNGAAETKKVIFKGWGCLNCGYIFQLEPENLEKNPKAKESLKSKKPICPKCKSSKTYSLIKKLTPD